MKDGSVRVNNRVKYNNIAHIQRLIMGINSRLVRSGSIAIENCNLYPIEEILTTDIRYKVSAILTANIGEKAIR